MLLAPAVVGCSWLPSTHCLPACPKTLPACQPAAQPTTPARHPAHLAPEGSNQGILVNWICLRPLQPLLLLEARRSSCRLRLLLAAGGLLRAAAGAPAAHVPGQGIDVSIIIGPHHVPVSRGVLLPIRRRTTNRTRSRRSCLRLGCCRCGRRGAGLQQSCRMAGSLLAPAAAVAVARAGGGGGGSADGSALALLLPLPCLGGLQ
jgi:hypothetical protein